MGPDGGGADADAAVTEADVFEQNAGYQAAYSRLAAPEGAAEDPVAGVGDVEAFVGAALVRAVREDAALGARVRAGDAAFVERLAAAGYVV